MDYYIDFKGKSALLYASKIMMQVKYYWTYSSLLFNLLVCKDDFL